MFLTPTSSAQLNLLYHFIFKCWWLDTVAVKTDLYCFWQEEPLHYIFKIFSIEMTLQFILKVSLWLKKIIHHMVRHNVNLNRNRETERKKLLYFFVPFRPQGPTVQPTQRIWRLLLSISRGLVKLLHLWLLEYPWEGNEATHCQLTGRLSTGRHC